MGGQVWVNSWVILDFEGKLQEVKLLNRECRGYRGCRGYRECVAADAATIFYGERKTGSGVREAGCGKVSLLMQRRFFYGDCAQVGETGRGSNNESR